MTLDRSRAGNDPRSGTILCDSTQRQTINQRSTKKDRDNQSEEKIMGPGLCEFQEKKKKEKRKKKERCKCEAYVTFCNGFRSALISR